jgi:hypothetical protein
VVDFLVQMLVRRLTDTVHVTNTNVGQKFLLRAVNDSACSNFQLLIHPALLNEHKVIVHIFKYILFYAHNVILFETILFMYI